MRRLRKISNYLSAFQGFPGICLLVLFLSLHLNLFAKQELGTFEPLTVEDGLSQSAVNAILQDERGFIWFGTDEGLNKYSGYDFEILKSSFTDTASLRNNKVLALAQNTPGYMWIGTGGGMDRLNIRTGAFQKFPEQFRVEGNLTNSYVTDLYAENDSLLWIASAWGLNKFNIEENKVLQYLECDYDTTPDSVNMARIWNIYDDENGLLLLGTDGGVRFFDKTKGEYVAPYSEFADFFYGIEDLQVSAVTGTGNTELWLGTENGLYHLNRETGDIRHYVQDPNSENTLSNSTVLSLLQDDDGNLWIGTNWGLNRFRPESQEFNQFHHVQGNRYSLSSNGISTMYMDKSGILWFGTYRNGVNKYVPSKQVFNNYRSMTTASGETLQDRDVHGLQEKNSQEIWLGTYTGIYILNPETNTLNKFEPDQCDLSENFIRDFLIDSQGILWVSITGQNSPQLLRYEMKSGDCRVFQNDPADAESLPRAGVLAIYEDRSNTLWLGTDGAGLIRYDKKTDRFIQYVTPDYEDTTAIAGNYVVNMMEDQQNNFWIATDGGLSLMDRKSQTFTTIPTRDVQPGGLSHYEITDIYETRDSVLWVGTSNGLNRYDSKADTFKIFNEDDGLKSSNIYGITEDENGGIWISTSRGLARFSPDSYSFAVFRRSDGIIVSDFNLGSCITTESGEVFFGGRKGLVSFKPGKLEPSQIKPPVVISEFRLYEEPHIIPEDHSIELRHDQQFFSFEFAVLDYTHPEENKYQYILEGLDTQWRRAGTRHAVGYTNVSPGEYTFRVRGANVWGQWNEAEPVHITIIPPYWQRAWFQILVGLFIVGIIVGTIRYRVYQVNARERELEHQVNERTRQIRQKNKELIRTRQALAEEKERLAVTLHSIGDGVITTDIHGDVVLVNEVAEKLTGWPHEVAMGKPLEEVFRIIHERTRRPLPNPVEKVLESESIVELANGTVLVAKDGTERIIADSGAPIKSQDDETIGVVLVFRDVTKEHRLEEEIQKTEKLRSVGILAGGIAHDFNNVLAVIVGNLSLSKLKLEEEHPVNNYVSIAEEAAWRAKELTQQLLTLSKGGEPVREIGTIEEPVSQAAEMALRGSNVSCDIDIPSDLSEVMIDDSQIHQVVKNLVINADQAMPDGGNIRINGENVTIKLDSEVPLNPGDYVCIQVRDAGEGIPPENQDKIFDPYFTTKEDGTGLGLFVAYSIVNKHDGLLTVDSRPGEGATFTFYLPAAENVSGEKEQIDTEASGEQDVVPADKNTEEVGELRILAMDDEDAVRQVVRDMLEILGYKVITAKNGEEAVTSYQEAMENENTFDAVILDLTIQGGMGGKETIEKLQEIDPDVRAIVSSGYSNNPIMANYEEYGFRGMVPKPYKLNEMQTVLRKVVQS
ncbi:MAG: response regulator [Candidatus Marinimicrobia bacterium]|nr:response regulator [Candidatus Neomarinimicrobiota bacterium]MCF7828091.1 response regulator [Candidatus Neomarinimicrobiota bacterium]MCF7879734.1 response regulator [Candidatus Neomarinimicrobiota bacterium]